MSTPFALRRQSKQIDGYTFDVGLLNVSIGRAVLVRLAHLIGGGASTLLSAQNDPGALGRVVGALLERLNSEDLAWLCEQFASVTNVTHSDGRKQPLAQEGVQNDVFAGRYLLLFQWLSFCVEVNYADFFEKARQSLAALAAVQETPTP